MGRCTFHATLPKPTIPILIIIYFFIIYSSIIMKNNFEFEKHKDTSTKHTCFEEHFNDLLPSEFIYNVYFLIGYNVIKIISTLTNKLFDN